MNRRPEDPRIAAASRRPLSPSRSNEAHAHTAGAMTPTAAADWGGPAQKRPTLEHNRPQYNQQQQQQYAQRPPQNQTQRFGTSPWQHMAAQQQQHTLWGAASSNRQGAPPPVQGGQRWPHGQQTPSTHRQPQQGHAVPPRQQPPPAALRQPQQGHAVPPRQQPPAAPRQQQPTQQRTAFGQSWPQTTQRQKQQNQAPQRPGGMTPRAPSASRVPQAQQAQQPTNNVLPTATRGLRPTGAAAGPSTAATNGASAAQKARPSPARASPARTAGHEQDGQRPSTSRDSETQQRRRTVAPNAALSVRLPSVQTFTGQEDVRRGLMQRHGARLNAVLNKIEATRE
ncbi:hypothetical protein AAVH_12311 [Aphelenchoides avenae]|nr:hypothetical protein AAVH_12311 [Aphelenchus avenae]